MAEKRLKSILYNRTVDYASRVVKNTDVMNFMESNAIVGKHNDTKKVNKRTF